MERLEEIERVEVEARFGIQKRKYGLNLIKGKKPASAMTMIMLIALVANLAHRMRGIRYILIKLLFRQTIRLKKFLTGVQVSAKWSQALA